jgi:translation initiation factor IF-2
VATLLVEEGSLKVGEAMVAGLYHGKVRAMINDHGVSIQDAGPATPVEVQGLSGVPDPGSEFIVLEDEKKAREVAEYRQRKSREAELVKGTAVSLENMFQKMEQDKLKVFNIVLKADVQGSLEAVADSLRKLATDKVRLEVVRGSIGAITESDVLLAAASNAIILGFNVKPVPKAKALAAQEGVEIRFYDVIYHAIEEIKAAMVGMLEPVFRQVELGRAEVRETFHITKVGTIAGCRVTEGVIRRNADAMLLRDNVVVHQGRIASLKRFKEDAREVQAGYECGIGFEKFNDIKVGDVIEAYEMEEMAPDLGVSVADQKKAEKKDNQQDK